METGQKISVGNVNSFNAEFNNFDDNNRTRDITANAEVHSSRVNNIHNGVVRERGSNTVVATFRGDLNMDFNRKENRAEDMAAVETFINELKSKNFGCTVEELLLIDNENNI